MRSSSRCTTTSDTGPARSPEIWRRMYHYFKTNREQFLKFYHRRSNVESTFAMIKMRLGEFLKSKNHESQRSELMMKFLVHNITCLVSEIFENEVHINFKECIKRYVEPEIKKRITKADFQKLSESDE